MKHISMGAVVSNRTSYELVKKIILAQNIIKVE
jgi:hypothetical protein